MSPLLRENGRTPAAYVGDANSLFWNFISFSRKPSYSASFLHCIFSLSYTYLTTLLSLILSYPDRRSRLPFELPGSTGAGPWQQGTDRRPEFWKGDRESTHWHRALGCKTVHLE